jgi:transposase
VHVVDEDRLKRHDLTDAEWARLEPLTPAHPRQGHRWNDHRTVINGIFHRVRTGCPWRDLPERFGPYQSAYGRHRRWSRDGTWERILQVLQAGCDQGEAAAWSLAVDSTVVRAQDREALGRCRGGLSCRHRSSSPVRWPCVVCRSTLESRRSSWRPSR